MDIREQLKVEIENSGKKLHGICKDAGVYYQAMQSLFKSKDFRLASVEAVLKQLGLYISVDGKNGALSGQLNEVLKDKGKTPERLFQELNYPHYRRQWFQNLFLGAPMTQGTLRKLCEGLNVKFDLRSS